MRAYVFRFARESGHRAMQSACPCHDRTKRKIAIFIYYVSLPHLHGESKTAAVGAVSRVPATDIENIIVKSLNERLIVRKEKSDSSLTHVRDSKAALEQVRRIDVHHVRQAVQLQSDVD